MQPEYLPQSSIVHPTHRLYFTMRAIKIYGGRYTSTTMLHLILCSYVIIFIYGPSRNLYNVPFWCVRSVSGYNRWVNGLVCNRTVQQLINRFMSCGRNMQIKLEYDDEDEDEVIQILMYYDISYI